MSWLREKTIDRARNVAAMLGASAGIRAKATVLRFLVAGRRVRSGTVRPPVPIPMRALGGEQIWVRPGSSDLVNATSYYRHELQLPPPEMRELELRVICELGTNAGACLTALGVAYPRARLLGVEPDPGNAGVARRNLERFGSRASVVEAGIWGEEAELVIDTSSEHGEHGFSIRPRRPGDPAGWQGLHATTIDALLDEHLPGEAVDYMHITIEGSEPEVFAAGGEWPRRVRSLRVELHPYFDFNGPECVAALEALGYEVWEAPSPPGKWVYAVRPETRAQTAS